MTVHELPTRLPADHLPPVWRRTPAANGIASMALDPREAQVVVERGWAVLDGDKWRATLGWDGIVEGDGRVDVRLVRIDDPVLLEAVA